MAAIPALEAQESLRMARAVGMALTGEGLAKAVYEATGDGRMAQQVEIQQARERSKRQLRSAGGPQLRP